MKIAMNCVTGADRFAKRCDFDTASVPIRVVDRRGFWAARVWEVERMKYEG
jgi:hypothetical protein